MAKSKNTSTILLMGFITIFLAWEATTQVEAQNHNRGEAMKDHGHGWGNEGCQKEETTTNRPSKCPTKTAKPPTPRPTVTISSSTVSSTIYTTPQVNTTETTAVSPTISSTPPVITTEATTEIPIESTTSDI